MRLLEYLEGRLGAFEVWPSYILQHIFHERPSPVASTKLKKVIAFFFGKAVPCFIASRFDQACNETASRSAAVSRFADEQFNEWYYVWMRAAEKVNNTIYFDMKSRKHSFINGPCYGRSEPLVPDLPMLNFGVDNTFCRPQILTKLQNIKTMSVFE